MKRPVLIDDSGATVAGNGPSAGMSFYNLGSTLTYQIILPVSASAYSMTVTKTGTQPQPQVGDKIILDDLGFQGVITAVTSIGGIHTLWFGNTIGNGFVPSKFTGTVIPGGSKCFLLQPSSFVSVGSVLRHYPRAMSVAQDGSTAFNNPSNFVAISSLVPVANQTNAFPFQYLGTSRRSIDVNLRLRSPALRRKGRQLLRLPESQDHGGLSVVRHSMNQKTSRLHLGDKTQRGNTLLIALATIAITVVLVGMAVSYTSHNGIQTQREQSFNKLLNAGDGALEYAFAQWKVAVRANGLRPPSNASMGITAPTAALHTGFQSSGVTFSNFSVVNANQWSETKDASNNTITNPVLVSMATIAGHPGWAGVASFCRATVTATMPSRRGTLRVNLARTFQVTGVPLFQAAIFFEHDIEMHPGALMIINGLVHTNGDLWLATAAANKLQFMTNVSYVGTYNEAYKPFVTYGGGSGGVANPNPPLWSDGLPSSSSTTFANQTSQTERFEPFGTEPAALFDTADTNPNNDGPREVIEPPVSGYTDPPEIAATRIYNQSTVRITLDRTKTGNAQVVIKNGSNSNIGGATGTAIRNAIAISTSPIYDWREGSNVLLTNVDMAKLDAAFAVMGSSFNGVVYFQDVTPTGKNAIRLQNGSVLTDDVTIASNNAVYIQGDFNTGGTVAGVHDPNLVPSNNGGNPLGTDSPVAPGYTKRSTAVMADAVMILSNSWNDAQLDRCAFRPGRESHTVNTGILSGIVPTNYQNSGVYSGGPHNFPRFLETWSGKDLTYNGSMVQTFNSQLFDGIFETSNVYNAPGAEMEFR